MHKHNLAIAAIAFIVFAVAASFSGCAAIDAAQTHTALDPVKVAKDREMALYLMRAAGCDTSVLAGVAAPVVTMTAGPAGGIALQAVSAAGQAACAVPVVVPPTALPSAIATK